MIPPPPNKGRPANLSSSAVLPTFRNRPIGNDWADAQKVGHHHQSVSSLFVANVCGNPTIQTLGKQAAKSLIQQRREQLRTSVLSAAGGGNRGRTATADGDNGNIVRQKPKGEGNLARSAAEKELEDIFGPSLSLVGKMATSSMLSDGQWSSTFRGNNEIVGPEKWAPVRPPPPKHCQSPQQQPHTPDPSSCALSRGISKYESPSAGFDGEFCHAHGDLLSPSRQGSDRDWLGTSGNPWPGERGSVRTPAGPAHCAALALFDFDTGVPGDLKFAASDRITVTGRVNQDWLRGHLHQHSGIFPVSFVHINPTDLARLTADPPISKRVVKALYDYKSEVSEDLSFRAGDLIELLAEWSQSEWAMGRLGANTGLVPLTFVERVEVAPR